MKIVVISDTHSAHRDVKLPEGDVLLHAGDLCFALGTNRKEQCDQIRDVDQWFGEQNFEKIICIAGNHDFPFHHGLFTKLNNAVYLQNGHYTYKGVKFFGSPNQLPFFGAFNAGEETLKSIYRQVDEDTDVLITHGAPYGILDVPHRGDHTGSHELWDLVQRIKPKLHVFGHIHYSYGKVEQDGTTFLNASQATRWKSMDNAPWVYEIEA
jgi:Icc-related predicted phosphoesterase